MLQGCISLLRALPARPGEDPAAAQPGCSRPDPSPAREQLAATLWGELGEVSVPAHGLEALLAGGLLPNSPQTPREKIAFR